MGRSVLADLDRIAWAVHLRDHGATIAQIVERSGVPRTSLYRHMPPRPPEALTADGGLPPADRDHDEASR